MWIGRTADFVNVYHVQTMPESVETQVAVPAADRCKLLVMAHTVPAADRCKLVVVVHT